MEVRVLDIIDQPTRVQVGGQGPPLLWLHGEANTWRWGPAHEALAQEFTVHAPVHPGFGGERLPDWLYDASDLTFHNAVLIETLGLDQPLVAGVSIGGWLALDLAARRPDLVGSLLAVGALGLRPSEPMPDLFIMQAPEALGYLAESFDTGAVDPLTGDVDAATELWVELAAQARLMWKRPYDHRLERHLSQVRCPSMVVWGANDRLLPVEHGRRLAELLGAPLDVVGQSGHMVTVDAPQAVAAAAARLAFSDQLEP